MNLLKLYDNPKEYTKKKFASAKKTIKDQPLSLAAGLFNLLSEFASAQASDEKQTPAAVLRALGSGSQLWANAKDATKKKETRRKVAEILSAPDIRTSDKVKMITGLGDFKTASTLERTHVVKKANKRSKAKIAEAVLHNRNTEEQAKENAKQKKDIAFKAIANMISENAKKRGFQRSENAKNRMANFYNTINAALGRYGAKNKMKASDYIKLIKDYGFAENVQRKSGVPYFGFNDRTTMEDPAGAAPTKKDLELLYQD